MAGAGEEMRRLAAVIERQRRELDRLRAAAASDSVVALARGVLMGRLGLSSAEAAGQLTRLAAATGTPLAEMAAAVIRDGRQGPAEPGARGNGSEGLCDGSSRPGQRGGAAEEMLQAAAELAADGAELAGTLAEQIVPELGADVIVLWLLEADGALALLGQVGLTSGEAGRWKHVPPQLDCPAQRVAHGTPDLWWQAGRADGDDTPLVGRADGARAVLALREPAGGLLGVLEVVWPGPLPGSGGDARHRLSALAAGCGQALGVRLAHGHLAAAQPTAALFTLLDGLADSVLVARAIRDDGGQVADFRIEHVSPGCYDPAGRASRELARLTLLEAYPASVSGRGLFARAVQALADGVPQHVPGPLHGLADVRVAPFYDGVIVTWRREKAAGRLAMLGDHAQRLGRLGGWEEDLTTGAVRWTDSVFGLFGLQARPGAEIPLAHLHSYVIAADKPAVQRFRRDLLTRREALTAAFRVVRPGDGSIRQIRVFAEPVADAAGAVVALRGAYQDVSAQYQTQVALAATRDQLADSEQRAAEEHRLAMRLQRAIMPPDEPTAAAAGIDVAVRYRPVGEGHLVGGDWYDTLLLPGNDVLLVVGDVAGHGIDAVTGMVAARNSLRALAITGAPPAELLRMLNGAMCHLSSGAVGTALCGIYQPQTRTLRWARAGHLPPVLVRDGTAAQLPLPGGLLLGMDPDAGYEEAACSLRPGDTLLLFTDGLIERRGESISDVLADFVAAMTHGPGEEPAAARADRIMALADSDTGDDACLVVVRVS